jgi:hypothetical protein
VAEVVIFREFFAIVPARISTSVRSKIGHVFIRRSTNFRDAVFSGNMSMAAPTVGFLPSTLYSSNRRPSCLGSMLKMVTKTLLFSSSKGSNLFSSLRSSSASMAWPSGAISTSSGTSEGSLCHWYSR